MYIHNYANAALWLYYKHIFYAYNIYCFKRKTETLFEKLGLQWCLTTRYVKVVWQALDSRTRAIIRLNPARIYTNTCKALRHRHKNCFNTSEDADDVKMRIWMRQAAVSSPLFESISTTFLCLNNVRLLLAKLDNNELP